MGPSVGGKSVGGPHVFSGNEVFLQEASGGATIGPTAILTCNQIYYDSSHEIISLPFFHTAFQPKTVLPIKTSQAHRPLVQVSPYYMVSPSGTLRWGTCFC